MKFGLFKTFRYTACKLIFFNVLQVLSTSIQVSKFFVNKIGITKNWINTIGGIIELVRPSFNKT